MKYKLLILLTFLAFHCTDAPKKGNESQTAPSGQQADNKAETSKKAESKDSLAAEENFTEFLTRFNKDSVFQFQRIKYPLIQISNDCDTTVTEKISEKEIKYINVRKDWTDYNHKRRDELIFEKISEENGKKVWTIGVQDSGLCDSYLFEADNGKWYLVQVEYSNC